MVFTKELSTVYDLCVIGSGPAGLMVAIEFAKQNPGKTVVIVEYGHPGLKNTNPLDDSIVIENKVNHHQPYECTNKGFGGTSATWGGRCVMYDEIDFENRAILNKDNTWGSAIFLDVQKYFGRAAEYFDCGEPIFNLNKLPQFKDKRIAEHFVEGIVTDSVLERWSTPTRFGRKYAAEISKSSQITLLEGYDATDFIKVPGNGNRFEIVVNDIKSTGPRVLQINAAICVIAAGAQECTRLLLRNKQLFAALPQSPASLGKYYQGHLSGKIASVKFYGDPKKTDFGFLNDQDGVYLRRRFQFTTDFLKQNNLLNTAIWLDNPLYYDPSHHSGAMSFMYMAMITPIIGKKLAPPAIAQSVTKGKVTGIRKHLLNIVKQLPQSVIIPATIFYRRYLLKRKLPGVFLYSPENKYALHFHSEQLPDENNRMELDNDGKTLIIKYALSDADIKSVIELHKVLDKWLRSCNCGELEYWFRDEELFDAIKGMSKDGIHQSGTTRIADSPAEGVVDANLKLWGTDNIYVCSSSVFPTSGQANPTFLLGAFALRLADHLTLLNEKN